MKPRKELLDRFEQKGGNKALAAMFTAIHLLMSEAAVLTEELSDMLSENGLMLGELAMWHTRCSKASNAYLSQCAELIKYSRGDMMAMFRSFEDFDKMFREYVKLPEYAMKPDNQQQSNKEEQK